MSETEQLCNRVEELQVLLGVGNDDVSRLLAVVDATPQTVRNDWLHDSALGRNQDGAPHRAVRARPDCDQPQIKLIDVPMIKVRKALEKVDVELRTEWGSGGWSIPAARRRLVAKCLTPTEPVPLFPPKSVRLQ